MVQLQLGPEVIRSYKRMSYTPWHALAEFVDNSTQSYFNNREILDGVFANEPQAGLRVSIVLDRADTGLIRISDNAMGMTLGELERALRLGIPPINAEGRSRYGLGLKMAACWFGNVWSIRTSKLGEDLEHRVTVDVETVASGTADLPYDSSTVPADDHYTILEISHLNRTPHGRTIGKIKDYLRSMYRVDIREGWMDLLWQGDHLEWTPDTAYVQARDGSYYRRDFAFDVNGKHVSGWAGVLETGSRSKAGFSILHNNRVVRGWPNSWRPETIFGPGQGSNDLVNQRLTGEVHLDDFEVSTTKDDILWSGEEEQDVEDRLKEECADYTEIAAKRRKRDDGRIGPSDIEVQAAVQELQREIASAEMADRLTIEEVPPPEVVQESLGAIREEAARDEPDFSVSIDRAGSPLDIRGYLAQDTSANDPYVVSESTDPDAVSVIVNMNHPHFEQLEGAAGVLNYLRHATYDALAEWQARRQTANIDPDTVKLLKDRLLRLPVDIEMHEGSWAPHAD